MQFRNFQNLHIAADLKDKNIRTSSKYQKYLNTNVYVIIYLDLKAFDLSKNTQTRTFHSCIKNVILSINSKAANSVECHCLKPYYNLL